MTRSHRIPVLKAASDHQGIHEAVVILCREGEQREEIGMAECPEHLHITWCSVRHDFHVSHAQIKSLSLAYLNLFVELPGPLLARCVELLHRYPGRAIQT